MGSKTREKKPTLAEKLKKVIGNISVDVFGYEKNVSQNIHTYYDRLSKETGMAKDEIIVRIFKDFEEIRVCVHKQGKRIKEIPVSELIILFTNIDPSGLPHLEQKAISDIQKFMSAYAMEYAIDPSHLHICILTCGDKVIVRGVHKTDELGVIPLMSLIKHFTK